MSLIDDIKDSRKLLPSSEKSYQGRLEIALLAAEELAEFLQHETVVDALKEWVLETGDGGILQGHCEALAAYRKATGAE